jgi:hypothetical protein
MKIVKIDTTRLRNDARAETLKIKPQYDAYLPLCLLGKTMSEPKFTEFKNEQNDSENTVNSENSGHILQELRGKYAADVATVGIGQWVAELESRNKAFENLVKERFDETAARTDIVLKEARAKLDEAYKTIAERVNALAVVEGAEDYEAFIRTLDAVIAKYAVKHHRHHHHAEPANGQPEGAQNDA